MLPLLRGINVFPLLCHAPNYYYLLEEGEGGRHIAEEVCWLTGVVGNELNGVLKGSVVGFGCLEQDGQLRGGCKHLMKPATSRRKVEDVGNRGARAEYMYHELSCEVLEQHVGNARVLDGYFSMYFLFQYNLAVFSNNLLLEIYILFSRRDTASRLCCKYRRRSETNENQLFSTPPLGL